MAKPKVEIDYETLDAMTLAGLKCTLKACKYILNNSSHAQDIKDYTEYMKAAKVLIKYYGG
jgi:hypothetical protein